MLGGHTGASGHSEFSIMAFPLCFLANCDVPKVTYDAGIKDNIRNAVLLLQNGIPLSPAGTKVPLLPFDPSGFVSEQVGREALDGVNLLEPRVLLDPNPAISQAEDGSVKALFAYYSQSPSEHWRTISVPLNKTG